MTQCKHCKRSLSSMAYKIYIGSGGYYYLCRHCHEAKKDGKDHQLIARGYIK